METIVYFMQMKTMGFIKIGRGQVPEVRRRVIEKILDDEMDIMGTIYDPTGNLEKKLHKKFRSGRLRINGLTEMFIPSPALMKYIETNAVLETGTRTAHDEIEWEEQERMARKIYPEMFETQDSVEEELERLESKLKKGIPEIPMPEKMLLTSYWLRQ